MILQRCIPPGLNDTGRSPFHSDKSLGMCADRSPLIDTTSANHEQLQKDEKRGNNEPKPQIMCLVLFSQFLAQQHLTHQLEAEHSQHPQQAQHSQTLLSFLIEADGYNGCEVGTEAISSEQG